MIYAARGARSVLLAALAAVALAACTRDRALPPGSAPVGPIGTGGAAGAGSGGAPCPGAACMSAACAEAEAGKSSIGCDYWVLKPDIIGLQRGSCFGVFVANSSSEAVHIAVSYRGADLGGKFIYLPSGQGPGLSYEPYDAAAGLPPHRAAVVFLAHDATHKEAVLCPRPPAVNGAAGILGTGFGDAFHVNTDRPVVMYSILPFGGGAAAITSASLLFPASAWDDNYVAVNPFAKSQIAGAGANPSLAILAREDTAVTLLPSAAIDAGGGVGSAAPNEPVTHSLKAGQYLQISQPIELTGSLIQANRRVAVWGGASCFNLPVDVPACDSAHQQIPPIRALGSRYAGVRYRNRATAGNAEEKPPWRVVGAVQGTELTWTPPQPNAPATIGLGQVATFEAAGPFEVQSQDAKHPFYLGQYMTGCAVYKGAGCDGDPEWVNVIPVEQYLRSYVLFTDPTYPETELVVVRRKLLDSDFANVTLDCAGTLGGWQAISDDLQYTRVPIATGAFLGVGKCANGTHELESAAPFAVTVWGWGTSATNTGAVSYAYPGGAGFAPINDVTVPPVPK
jgi:hypothetical protein